MSTFDGFNQLKRMEKIKAGEQITVDYTFNGDGLRTQKVVRSPKDGYAEKVTNYLYDRQHVVLETDAPETDDEELDPAEYLKYLIEHRDREFKKEFKLQSELYVYQKEDRIESNLRLLKMDLEIARYAKEGNDIYWKIRN